MRRLVFLAVLAASLGQASAQAQPVTVYDSLNKGAIAGYGELNTSAPTFGDSLNLAQGGTLNRFGFSIFNSAVGGNSGAILTGTVVASFYDNTVPYAGGSLATSDPLIGSAPIVLDFTNGGTVPGGLPVSNFSRITFDLTSFGFVLPPNIVVTQQFTETTGTSTANGVVLFGDSTLGSSPNNVYIKSTATPEGLYSFAGTAANSQFGYSVQVTPVPEPGTLTLCGLAVCGITGWRRRRRAA